MQFRREIEHAVLAAVKEAITGRSISHEDSHTKAETTYRIAEVKPDRYGDEPCLFVRCLPDSVGSDPEDGTVEVIIRAGFLDT